MLPEAVTGLKRKALLRDLHQVPLQHQMWPVLMLLRSAVVELPVVVVLEMAAVLVEVVVPLRTPRERLGTSAPSSEEWPPKVLIKHFVTSGSAVLLANPLRRYFPA